LKISILLYNLYATVVVLINYLRGEKKVMPSYAKGYGVRERVSLTNLSESIAFGWEALEKGEYSGAIVCYAATIGEFHPLVPVIESYLEHSPNTPLVIFSGQAQYFDAIRAAYPRAAVGLLPPIAPWLYQRLFGLIRPRVVILGEGPCLYLHFPIPFELAIPATCLRHGVPLVVVNSTLHAYHSQSFLDKYLKGAFGKIFAQAIRFYYTPNDIFKSWLTEAGVESDRIVVTGDLRFDDRRGLTSPSDELKEILDHLRRGGAPIIVAGSVNAIDEEGPVIDGWLELRKKHAGTRLIMAPRHVNNAENMRKLYAYLEAKGVHFAKRSEGAEAAKNADAVVVDVFGELPHFYSVASIAYIGRNHGVLEPLRFRVPTVVAPQRDWASHYVTFPVYKHMIDQGGIIEAPDKGELGRIFCQLIDEPEYGRQFVENAVRVAEAERGAGQRIVSHMISYVNG